MLGGLSPLPSPAEGTFGGSPLAEGTFGGSPLGGGEERALLSLKRLQGICKPCVSTWGLKKFKKK